MDDDDETKQAKFLSSDLTKLRKTLNELEENFKNVSIQNKKIIQSNKELVY